MNAQANVISARKDLTDQRPPLSRLTRVELRKMVDTRSGFWLQLSVAALIVLVVVITLIAGVGKAIFTETYNALKKK